MKQTILCLLLIGALLGTSAAGADDLSPNDLVCNAARVGGLSNLATQIPDFVAKCYRQGQHLIARANRLDIYVGEANGIFKTLLAIAPNRSYGWAGLAALDLRKFELGDPSVSLYQALRYATRAEQFRPVLPANQIVIGRIDLLLHCLPCAKDAAQKAELMGPDNSEVLALHADIEAQLGHTRKAVFLYDKAIRVATTKEGRTRQYIRLGKFYASQNDIRQARRIFSLAVRQEPTNPAVRLQQAAFLLFDAGDPAATERASRLAARAVVTLAARKLESLAQLLALAQRGQYPTKNVWQRSFLSPEEALIVAAEHRPLLPLVKILAQRKTVYDLQYRDKNGNTALLAACRGGNTAAVHILLAAAANPNIANSRGETPLMYAVGSGNLEIVQALLRKGANAVSLDVDGDSALSIAVFARRASVVKLILPRIGRKPLAGRWTAGDLLVMAAQNADLESVRDLVKWGIPVDSRNSAGQTPLIAAVLAKSPDVVGYLLKHKADEGLTYKGRTAPEIAHELGDPELTKEFMSVAGSTI